jgi:hypothetical protein
VSLVGHTKSLLLLANDSQNSQLTHWQAGLQKVNWFWDGMQNETQRASFKIHAKPIKKLRASPPVLRTVLLTSKISWRWGDLLIATHLDQSNHLNQSTADVRLCNLPVSSPCAKMLVRNYFARWAKPACFHFSSSKSFVVQCTSGVALREGWSDWLEPCGS